MLANHAMLFFSVILVAAINFDNSFAFTKSKLAIGVLTWFRCSVLYFPTPQIGTSFMN
jgi:hypothetical protein